MKDRKIKEAAIIFTHMWEGTVCPNLDEMSDEEVEAAFVAVQARNKAAAEAENANNS